MLVYLPLSLARAAFFLWQSLTGENYNNAVLERMNLALTLDPAPVREHLGITSSAVSSRVSRPEVCGWGRI